MSTRAHSIFHRIFFITALFDYIEKDTTMSRARQIHTETRGKSLSRKVHVFYVAEVEQLALSAKPESSVRLYRFFAKTSERQMSFPPFVCANSQTEGIKCSAQVAACMQMKRVKRVAQSTGPRHAQLFAQRMCTFSLLCQIVKFTYLNLCKLSHQRSHDK